MLAKICWQIVFAIVVKGIIEKKLCQKSLTNIAKIAGITNLTRIKKDPEMSANIAKIAKVTRIFLAS